MLKKMIMLILPVLVFICFTGCAGKKQCTMIVTISGDGFSESGEPLGSSAREETFTIKKSSKFYETSPGSLNTKDSDPNKLLFKITDIDEDGVTIKSISKLNYNTGHTYSESKVSFGTTKTISSMITVHDGRNYKYRFKFEKNEPQ